MARRLSDRIGRYYRRDVVTVGEEASAIKTLDLMNRTMMNTVYVVDNRKPVGFINSMHASHWLISRKLFLKPLSKVKASDIMDQYMENDPRIIRKRQTIRTAAQVMIDRDLDELPVVDSHGDIIGRITLWDLLRGVESKLDGNLRVKNFATDEFVSCEETHSLYYLICQLPLTTTRAVIVKDSSGAPAGIIFKDALDCVSQMLRCRQRATWRGSCGLPGGFPVPAIAFLTAEEIMSRSFIEVKEDDYLKSVIDLMVQMKTEVYPVVDDNGKLVKVVTAREIIRRLLLS